MSDLAFALCWVFFLLFIFGFFYLLGKGGKDE
jgi:hypothetical protein